MVQISGQGLSKRSKVWTSNMTSKKLIPWSQFRPTLRQFNSHGQFQIEKNRDWANFGPKFLGF